MGSPGIFISSSRVNDRKIALEITSKGWFTSDMDTKIRTHHMKRDPYPKAIIKALSVSLLIQKAGLAWNS